MPRFVTLTLNPAVDMSCSADGVRPTHKVRTSEGRFDPGGGGVNVARVLHALGGDVLAVVLTGGVTGRLIEELLDEAGLRWQALAIAGRTRISLNVYDRRACVEYRFVPDGPSLQEAEWRRALEPSRYAGAGWIVASGSLPPGVPTDFYARLAAVAAACGARFALDTSGEALAAARGHGLDLLKLSLGELEFLSGASLPDGAAQDAAVRALLGAGVAGMIAVSLGRDGALLATRDVIARQPTRAVEAGSAVGAGDAFLAGVVFALGERLPPDQALALGNAVGTAAVAHGGAARLRRHHLAADWAAVAAPPAADSGRG